MNEYRCGKCGWTAHAPHPDGVVQASKDHTKEGCTDD
jgi:predicted small metal-binding protein